MFGWQAIFIPSRAFSDSASRVAFRAAAAKRIKAAESIRP